jgi:CSLREA domain-containing protein
MNLHLRPLRAVAGVAALAACGVLAAANGTLELVGDFDADGRPDRVIATIGADRVEMVDASGRVHVLQVPGSITAVTAGELHRPDGLPELVLGIDGAEGPAVLVYGGGRGAWRASAVRIAIDAPALALATGEFDGDVAHDLVITTANGRELLSGGDQYFAPEKAHAWSRRGVLPPGQPLQRIASAAEGGVATFVVTTTVDVDDGICDAHCSLREAIAAANANTLSPSVIEFAIPAGGSIPTIVPLTPLPVISQTVTLDGRTQPGGFVEVSGVVVALGSPDSGITFAGAGSLLQGMVVNGFDGPQVSVQANGVRLFGNRLGTSADGSQAIASSAFPSALLVASGSDVRIGSAAGTTPGGACTGDCNLFGGTSTLIRVHTGSSATFHGNYIGVDVTGTHRIGTPTTAISTSGLVVIGGPGPGEGNLVVNASSDTISLSGGSDGSVVQGNRVGTDATGTVVLGAGSDGIAVFSTDVLIGGTAGVTPGGPCTGACNLVAGAGSQGIELNGSARRTVVQGNFVGTDVSGSMALGNANGGVLVRDDPALVGGNVPEAANLLSGNRAYGLSINDTTSQGPIRVIGNLIGVAADGVSPLPNGLGEAPDAGVDVTGAGELFIGGVAPGEGNRIAHNRVGVLHRGLFAEPPDVRGNAIFDNDELGIDLYDDGVTANDDAESIPYTNQPVIEAAMTQQGQTRVSGSVTLATADSGVVDVYGDAECDASGHGEGAVYLGSVDVGAGGGGFELLLPASVAVGSAVSATATSSRGTSEFSACATVETVEPVDLAVQLSSPGTTVSPGRFAEFRVLVQHLSGPDVADATTTLVLPPGSSQVSAAGADCALQPGVLVCALPPLGQGGSVEVVVQARMSASLQDGGQVTLTATVGSFADDPDPGNNSAVLTLGVSTRIFRDGFED